jgi:hypothetical protein
VKDRPPARFFGPLPSAGPWNPAGLTGAQFWAILGFATAVFLVFGGPVWRHLRDSHVERLVVSYVVIPPAVLLALRRNRTTSLGRFIGATVLVSVAKFLLTAVLLVVIALGRPAG